MQKYLNDLNGIVHDECKEALKSIWQEFKTVTFLAEMEDKYLNDFFSNKSQILLSKGYGKVLEMCSSIKRGWNIVRQIDYKLDAIARGSTIQLSDIEEAANLLLDLHDIEFSKKKVWGKPAVKKPLQQSIRRKKNWQMQHIIICTVWTPATPNSSHFGIN